MAKKPIRSTQPTHSVELWEVGDEGMSVGTTRSIRLCLYIPESAFLLWAEKHWVHTVHKGINDQFHESSKKWASIPVSAQEYARILKISKGVPVGKVAYMNACTFTPEKTRSRHVTRDTKRAVKDVLRRGLSHTKEIEERFNHQVRMMS
jgi:hypothetical protein